MGQPLSHGLLFATPWTGLLCPWDSQGKNTGVGCHFLPNPGREPVSPAVQMDSLQPLAVYFYVVCFFKILRLIYIWQHINFWCTTWFNLCMYCKMITTTSTYIVSKLFSRDENFKIYSFSNFQIRNTVLLTLVAMLYSTSPWLTHFITEAFDPLHPFHEISCNLFYSLSL